MINSRVTVTMGSTAGQHAGLLTDSVIMAGNVATVRDWNATRSRDPELLSALALVKRLHAFNVFCVVTAGRIPVLRANFVVALAVGVSWQVAVNAQEMLPKFDVASVKLAGPTERRGYNHTLTPGGVTMLGVSLGYCVRLAYGLSSIRPYELAGPIWMDPPTDLLVDIVAKTETPASEEQIKLMLQALLSERFKLAAHHEQREMAAYELRVVSDSPALRKSAPGTERKIKPAKGREELFQNFSMADFALQLGPPLTTRPVVDKTGLEGGFDFRMDLGPYVTDPQTGALIVDAIGRIDSEGATFRALKDQLGLALKPGHTLVDVLVIDHLEKTPSGN